MAHPPPRTVIINVCSSNTCRSPMAEAFAKQWFSKKLGVAEDQLEAAGWSITSAGLTEDFQPAGSPASASGVAALRTLFNIDISSHRSRLLTASMAQEAACIYTVSERHRRWISHMLPGLDEKIKVLGDIPDPYEDGAQASYDGAAQQIHHLMEVALEQDFSGYLLGAGQQH